MQKFRLILSILSNSDLNKVWFSSKSILFEIQLIFANFHMLF